MRNFNKTSDKTFESIRNVFVGYSDGQKLYEKRAFTSAYSANYNLSKIKSLLTDNLNKRNIFAQDEGDIDDNNLDRYKTDGLCFKQERGVGGQKYCFHIAIDVSGSMDNGRKTFFVSGMVTKLVKVLSGIVDIKIYLFDENVLDSFYIEKKLDKSKLISLARTCSICCGGTNFLPVMAEIETAIKTDKNNCQHVLLFITDGGCGTHQMIVGHTDEWIEKHHRSYRQDNRSYRQDRYKKYLKHKKTFDFLNNKIESILVGIGSSSEIEEAKFNNCCQIQDASGLAKIFYSFLLERIKRGK